MAHPWVRRTTAVLCGLFGILLFNQAVAKPAAPVILIHGLAGSADAWVSLGRDLTRTHWVFGGCPLFDRTLELVSNLCASSAQLRPGDFYRMQFSDNQNLTLHEQAQELEAIIAAVLSVNPGHDRVILVGHSMGGLAARSYLQLGLQTENVLKLITVGTPHLGAEIAFVCGALPSFVCRLAGIDPGSIAVEELKPDSSALLTLNDLHNHPLPNDISYLSIIGTGASTPGGPEGDGIVPALSQNLGNVVGASALSHTAKSLPIMPCGALQRHTCEPGDTGVRAVLLDQLETGTPVTVVATDVPRDIPDPGQIVSSIKFQGRGIIVDANLFFQFTHSCERDLKMTLRHPDGTFVIVMDRGNETCFGTAVTFTSDNRLLGPFFLGKQAAGTWTLTVTDDSPGYSGTLDFWSLTLFVR